MTRLGLTLSLLAPLAASALFATQSAAAQAPPSPCLGDPSADAVAPKPAPPLRFGITPAGEAGALGPAVALTPIDRRRTLKALASLRPHGAPFVLRLNRF